MFDGRHCTNKDLDLLLKETKKVKAGVSSFEFENYLKLIERFDKEIADRLRIDIERSSREENVIKAIDKNINELIQNIIVDINEHT